MTKRLLKEIALVAIFKLLIDFVYLEFLSEDFAYAGLHLDFNLFKFFESLVALVIIYKSLRANRSHKLYFSIFLVFLVLIVPTLSIYGLRNESRLFFYIIISGFNLFLILIKGKKLALQNLNNFGRAPFILSLGITAMVVLHYIENKGLGAINFDFDKVYNFREKYGESDNEGVFGYLNSWTSKVLNVLLIIWSFHKRKWVWTAFFISIQIILYGLSGHKAAILTVLPLLVLYFLRNKDYLNYIIKGCVGALILIIFYTYYTDDISIVSLVVRRALIVPAHLNFDYYNYFSANEFVYWSNSILSSFIKYPYSEDAQHVIGRSVGKPEMHANTGLFGTGYMHFGIVGVLIYILITAFFVIFLNSLKTMPSWILNGIILIPFLTLFYSSDLFTALLTHGFLPAVLLLYLYNDSFKYNRHLLK